MNDKTPLTSQEVMQRFKEYVRDRHNDIVSFRNDIVNVYLLEVCIDIPELQPYLIDAITDPLCLTRFIIWAIAHPNLCYVDLNVLKERMWTGVAACEYVYHVGGYYNKKHDPAFLVELPDLLDRLFFASTTHVWLFTKLSNIHGLGLAGWLSQFKDLEILLPRCLSRVFSFDLGFFLSNAKECNPELMEEVKEFFRLSLYSGDHFAAYVRAFPEECHNVIPHMKDPYHLRDFVHSVPLPENLLREILEIIYSNLSGVDLFCMLWSLKFPLFDEFIDCCIDPLFAAHYLEEVQCNVEIMKPRSLDREVP